MQLRFLGIDTGKDGCPTLYASDRDTYVIQGGRVGDPAMLAGLCPSDDETCVEVPQRLMTFLETDVPDGILNNEPSPFILTNKGTYLIKGTKVTDPEALTQMDIPVHETAIEVPVRLMIDLAKEVAWGG